jgi:RHS repeat-associated protein
VRPNRSLLRLLSITCLLFLSCSVGQAQVTHVGDDTSTPIPGVGHDYIHLLNETVNPANGSLSLRIAVPMPPGRGVTIPFAFAYDSNGVNHLVPDISGNAFFAGNTNYLSQGGWSYSVPMFGNSIVNQSSSSGTCSYATDYTFQDPLGGRHSLYLSVGSSNYMAGLLVQCGLNVSAGGDVQYYASTPPGCNNGCGLQQGPITVSDSDGTVYSGGPGNHTCSTCGLAYSGIVSSVEDRNGNKVSLTDKGNGAITITDTLGRTAISTSGFGTAGTTDSVSVTGLATAYQIQWETAAANYSVPAKSTISQQSCSIRGVNSSETVVKSIVLPNHQQYQFFYDPTYGLLTEIIYPSGAWVKYTWKFSDNYSELTDFPVSNSFYNGPCDWEYSTPVIATRTVSFNGATPAQTQTFSYSTTWPGGSANWTQKATTVSTTDNILNKTSKTVYSYNPYQLPSQPDEHNSSVANQIPIESQIQYYDWGGTTPIRTVTKSWLDVYRAKSQQTTLDNNQSSQIVYPTYSAGVGPQSAGSLATEADEYDFGQTAPTRKTLTTFQTFSNTPGVITDRPCKIVISDGSGNPAAETDYSYDGATSLCSPISAAVATGGAGGYSGHDGVTFSTTATTPRGNVTTKTQRCFVGTITCSNPVTVFTYDETGQVLSAKDANGNTTQYSYADSFSDSTPSMPTDAYLTKITYPPTGSVSHVESFSYAYSDGQLTVSTDQNLLQTQYFYVDSLRRLTETDFPDTGKTKISYNDTAPSPTITSSRLMNTANVYVTSVATLDGLGHIVKTLLTVDQDCANGDRTDTTYDGLGRIYTVSNPYCVAGEGTSGLTTYIYDGLGRRTTVTHPDGATVLTSYTGRATEVQDEGNGTQRVTRISQSDGLGRLTSLCEVSSATLIGQNAAPGACNQDISASGFLTSYQYNALDDLTRVTQGTMASRAFAYDSLSRLTSGTNPESGITTYSYDANSNLASKTAPAPNQTGTSTVTTTYSYDALNRLTQKSYSDTNPVYANGTPTVFYGYDQSSITMTFQHSIANSIGRLSWSAPVDQNFFPITMDAFSYDQVGRVKQYWQQEPVNRNVKDTVVGYDYDLIGNPIDFFVAANQATSQGVVQNLTYNGVGRLASFSENGFNNATHPANLLSGITYDALGLMTSATFASGLTQTWAYNKRGSVTNMAVGTGCSSGTCSSSKYSYALARALNGNITSATDTVNQNWTYSYDALNRLVCSSLPANGTCPTSGTPTFSYTYDRFGNRWNQTGPNTFNATFTGNSPASPQNNNRIDGYCYDGAGNLLDQGPCLTGANPTQAFKYDAENRLIAVNQGATTYIYDGQGRRVQKNTGSTTESYLFDKDSNPISNSISGSPSYDDSSGYIGNWHFLTCFVNAAHNACTIYFHYGDWLGSKRISTDVAGNIAETCTSLPFGDGQNCTGAQDVSPMHFTGKERDPESGLDNFGARYDSSSMGRFMSPDPLAGHTEDPQTLNRYVYVRNNPLSLTDPTGLDFYLSCQQASATCGKDAAGNLVQGTTTTNANGNSTFNATVVTSASLQDPNSGNTATVNQNGVQITTANGTAQGIFINNTPAADIQGSGKLSDFEFHIDSSNEKIGTLDAGSYTYEGSRNQADVVKTLTDRGAFQYNAEKLFGNPFHTGDLNFRFSSGAHPELFDYGPSPHLLVPNDPRATVPVGPGYVGQFHIDSHTGDVSHGGCALLGVGCK